MDYIVKPPKRIELITGVAAALRLNEERRQCMARDSRINANIARQLAMRAKDNQILVSEWSFLSILDSLWSKLSKLRQT